MIAIDGLGSVELVDTLGNATSVVNSARVSLGKRVDKISPADMKLLKFLVLNEHTSPFRHVAFTFHLRLPLFVLRQWNKHQVGCSWNEMSGRYVKFDPDFGRLEWRAQSKSIKQGSLGTLEDERSEQAQDLYEKSIQFAYDTYSKLLDLGVCKEQARTILPQSLITECWWTCSLHALLHFLDLRLHSDAQVEIQIFAQAVRAEAFEDKNLRDIADLWLEIGSSVRQAKKKFDTVSI